MLIMDIVKSVSPMGLMDSMVSFMGFNMIHNSLNEVMERNMANIFTALFHATGCASMSIAYLLDNNPNLYHLLIKFSTGYFLYDSIHSVKYIKHPLSTMYAYHHLATTFYLHQDPIKYKVAQIIGLGELSNIPSYFVYYFLKTKNEKRLALAKKIQFYTYSLIRLPIATYFTYDILMSVNNRIPIYSMIPVYFMGLFWSYKLWKKL